MSECKGCGRRILWGRSIVTGARVPLDRIVPANLYEDVSLDVEPTDQEMSIRPMLGEIRNLYISHFLTCPDANKFSGRNRP